MWFVVTNGLVVGRHGHIFVLVTGRSDGICHVYCCQGHDAMIMIDIVLAVVVKVIMVVVVVVKVIMVVVVVVKVIMVVVVFSRSSWLS